MSESGGGPERDMGPESMKSQEVVELSDEKQRELLLDIADTMLESEDREYLDDNPDFDVDEVSAYVVGRLQELGYDFEEVFERASLY